MNKVIIALDFNSFDEVKLFLRKFSKSEKLFLKVGMELFYSLGKEIITYLKENGHNVFLDLKLHDIPTTVYKSMKVLSSLKVDLINLHVSGGNLMMSRGVQGLIDGSIDNFIPKCIGVTQLTSTSQEILTSELLIHKDINDVILSYAKNAKKSGLSGVVCSPKEVPLIKENCGKEFLTITPGIRLKDDSVDDQVRVVTPKDAKKLGSDFIVVGRSITMSNHPEKVYLSIKEDME